MTGLDAAAWMQQSVLGHVMRHSGRWTYPLVNLSHVLGVALLFGAVVILDLRLIGAWRRTPIAPLANTAVPVAFVGFVLAATSGLGLLATNATEYADNPFIYVKLVAIALGLCNAAVLNLSAAWRARGVREPSPRECRQLAWMGGASLVCWLTAVSAGRLIGYW